MLRLLLGLVKGAVLGGGLGYGAYALGLGGGFHWVTYGLVGALVGLLCGRPVWSHLRDSSSTMWTAILKAVVGYGVGVGLYALVAKAWGGFELALMGEARNVVDWTFVLGGAIGAIYGAFVEVDDAAPAGAAKPSATKPGAKPAARR
jgi:hypothetical protein